MERGEKSGGRKDFTVQDSIPAYEAVPILEFDQFTDGRTASSLPRRGERKE
jgi:hypothetical protein